MNRELNLNKCCEQWMLCKNAKCVMKRMKLRRKKTVNNSDDDEHMLQIMDPKLYVSIYAHWQQRKERYTVSFSLLLCDFRCCVSLSPYTVQSPDTKNEKKKHFHMQFLCCLSSTNICRGYVQHVAGLMRKTHTRSRTRT